MANEVIQYEPTGLVRTETFMPVMDIQQAVKRYNMIVEFTKQILKEGRDYGVIPGTEKKNKDGQLEPPRNTLLKPGAEKLCMLFGLTPVFEETPDTIADFQAGLFHYSYSCILIRNARREIIEGKAVITGDVVGTGIGSCNSREKKYRRGGKACPDCGQPTLRRSKYPPRDNPEATPGWYCHDKSGGCGLNFDADDPAIMDQGQVFDPNAAADLVNTIMKMAQKRALLSATLVATTASEFFTQDQDDEEFHRKDEQDHRPKANQQRQQQAKAANQQKPPEEKKPDTPADRAAWIRQRLPQFTDGSAKLFAEIREKIWTTPELQEWRLELQVLWCERAIALAKTVERVDQVVGEFNAILVPDDPDYARLQQLAEDRAANLEHAAMAQAK